MEIKTKNEFNNFKKAALVDLKKDGMIKSVKVYKEENGKHVAIVEDKNSNSIKILVGNKSSKYIEEKKGLTEALEESAFIMLLNDSEEELRFTTSDHEILRHIFNLPPTDDEQKDIQIIKAILLKKGLRS